METEPTSAASAWMLRHSGWRLNRCGPIKSGASSHWKFIQMIDFPLFAMIECSMSSYRTLGGVLVVAKLAPRTFRALWVGRAEGSDEHLVVNELGHVVRVRGVRRCVEMRTVVQTFSNSLRPDAGDDVDLQDSGLRRRTWKQTYRAMRSTWI